MDTEPVIGKQLDWKDLLPFVWRDANIQSPKPMPAMPVPDPIPAIQCLTLADNQQPEDVIWNYQTPCNISDHAAFSPTDVSNMDTVWSSANTICYSTTRANLGEMLAQPKHTARESAAFVLEHVALILGVAYAIYWAYRACCGRRKTRAAAREPLSMKDLGVEAIRKADISLKQLATAERQRDEVLAANGELLEEHARQEKRINEADDATKRLENELADLKNELSAAEERISKSEEEDAEWDAKYDDLVVQNTELRKGIAASTEEKNKLITEKNMRDKSTSGNAETQPTIDRLVIQDMNAAEMKDLQDEVARLTAGIDKLRQDSAAETTQLKNTLEKTIVDHKAENDNLSKDAAVIISAEKKSLQDEVARLTGKLSNDVGGLTTEKNALQNELDLLRKEKKNDVHDLNMENEELQQDVTTLQALNQELGKNVDTLIAEKSELTKVLGRASTEKKDMQDHVNTLTAENEKLRNGFDGIATADTELKQSLEKADAENIKLQSYVGSLNQMVLELGNEVEQLKAENESLRNASVEAKDLDDLNAKLSEGENARDEYAAEINNLKDQLASTQNQVNSMYTEAEFNEERANHDLTKKEFDDTKVELEFIQDKLDNAAWKIEAAENKQESAEELVKSKDDELKSAMEKLRSTWRKFQVAEDTRASLEAANEQLKASVHKLSKEVESKKTELSRKENELNTHLETCKGSSTNVNPEDKDLFGPDPNQELLQERNELLGELATAENNKSVAEAERDELAAKLHEREQELSNSHANGLAKVQEIKGLQRQVNKSEKEVRKLHATILTKNRKINQLELDLKRARGEYESENEEGQAYNAPYGGEKIVMVGPEEITSNDISPETRNAEDTQPLEHLNEETNEETEADPDSNSTEDIMNAFMEDPSDDYATWAQGQQSEGQQGMSSTEDLDAVVWHTCLSCDQEMPLYLKEIHEKNCEDWAEYQRNEQSDEPVDPITFRAVLGQDSGNPPEFDISLV
jgi:chromosome segregation ATPase